MTHDLVPNSEPLTVYVVAGPNGAGKTTFATEFLPGFVHCREFLNADLIAAGLSPFAQETQNFRAGRLMLTRFRELADQRTSFGFETTLSGRVHLGLLRDLRQQGYRVVLFFLWLRSAELAIRGTCDPRNLRYGELRRESRRAVMECPRPTFVGDSD